MTPLKVKWYEGRKGRIGIAKVQADDGNTEYRIGTVDGFLEHMDVQQVVAWGVRFPIDAGDALFLEIV